MNSAPTGRIGEQTEAYRKGVVLGLTMAEVGILLVFVLLLLLAFGELRHKKQLQAFAGKSAVSSSELARLQAGDSALQQIAQVLGASPAQIPDDFVRLVRTVAQAAQSPGAQTALREARASLDEMARARQEMQRVLSAAQKGGVDSILGRMKDQSFTLANQAGQINRLQRQLTAAGQGAGVLPCWAQHNGNPDYLYDVVLTNSGIKMREYSYPGREEERSTLPAPNVNPSEILSEGAFLERTRPLFEYSQEHDCRFFVVVYDGTGPSDKQIYKDHLRAVEGHFYKRLDNGSPPF